MNDSMRELFGEVIDTYTRAEAIEDGILIAVPHEAQRAAHLRFPVALTSALHGTCVARPGEDGKLAAVMEAVRLRELLWLAHNAMRSQGGQRAEFMFCYLGPGGEDDERTARVAVVIGGGDQGEPVLTVRFASEG
ncbi:hypothetical protein F7Q99_36155 [Streptomyces kaniharaensis]|uniref:Uncharacterized protein n=1 Tax=Streptomyces kaniharaensis TaxID=212423 RepID=A0A6N7L0G3_9ACTN|nr:DUF6573 family protein [Streptomyces kaniharaensis]MQS17476.1 hypothetical protein [Streptomyces kaniharaensis]